MGDQDTRHHVLADKLMHEKQISVRTKAHFTLGFSNEEMRRGF